MAKTLLHKLVISLNFILRQCNPDIEKEIDKQIQVIGKKGNKIGMAGRGNSGVSERRKDVSENEKQLVITRLSVLFCANQLPSRCDAAISDLVGKGQNGFPQRLRNPGHSTTRRSLYLLRHNIFH